jgi:hypothetical protein
MNEDELSRQWFDFSFENPDLINPNHAALYFFAIEHCNCLGWKEKFGLPTEMAKDAIGIKSYNTYIKTLNNLVEWGFVNMIEKSKNQYSSNIIALSNNDKAPDKALDKAIAKAIAKATSKQLQSTGESTGESISSIDKHITKEPLTNKPVTIEQTKAKINFDEIMEMFNLICLSLPKIKSFTKDREKSITKILANYTKEDLDTVFKKSEQSDFLTGKKGNWKSNFDWVLNPKNFIKILENNYKNIENGQQATGREITFDTNRG